MSDISMREAAVATGGESRPYVDWAAVVAGAVVATAIFVTLTTFGSAIGLSITSPYMGAGTAAKAMAIAVAIWTLWVVISSCLVGGYIAGRLRHRSYDANAHESRVRQGAQGLTAWALTALLGGILLSTAVGALTPKSNMPGASTLMTADHAPYDAESLLRGGAPTGVDDVAAILRTGAYGGRLAADDRAYLVKLVATRTGASQGDAEARVDAAVADVRSAADTARKVGILVAFLTAAALALGAAGAWYAAILGGQHRDADMGLSLFTRWS
jgi:hypothetical protein